MVKTLFNTEQFVLQTLNENDDEIMKSEWYPLLTEIFTDPNDLEPIEQLLERLHDTEKHSFSLLRDANGTPVGLRLIQTNPEVPGAGYIPWGGVVEDLRNKGVYPRLVQKTLEDMKDKGLIYSLHDFEDPARIRTAYPDEPEGVPELRATKRLNFFRRSLNAYIIDDPDVPYIRPSSEDNNEIQAYDLLSFSALDYDHPSLEGVFNEDRTAVSKEAYRRFFIEINQLQYGALLEEELRAEFPAIEQFLTTLDQSPKQWFSLKSDQIVRKVTPDLEATIA